MSDGPHRSLPMRSGWKRLAKRADQTAYDVEQVVEAMPHALLQDCRTEITPALIDRIERIAAGEQGLLFAEHKISALEALKRECAGRPLAVDLLDRSIQAVSQGKHGSDFVSFVAQDMLRDYVPRCLRSVEEHFLRKTGNNRRADNVRAKLDLAAGRIDLSQIVGDARKKSGARSRTGISRRKGLDDGVPL